MYETTDALAAIRGLLTRSEMPELRLRGAEGVEMGEEGREVELSKKPLSSACSTAPADSGRLTAGDTLLRPNSSGLHFARCSMQEAACTPRGPVRGKEIMLASVTATYTHTSMGALKNTCILPHPEHADVAD